MLLYMYQVFSSLLGHLYFFVHFLFTFMEYFFLTTLYSFSHKSYAESFPWQHWYISLRLIYIYTIYIGWSIKKYSIKVKKKCTKNWRWHSRELKTWHMYNNIMVFLFTKNIARPKKKYSIKVKEKCPKKWRWPCRELKTWYMWNNIMVILFVKKYFSYFDLYSWYGHLNV